MDRFLQKIFRVIEYGNFKEEPFVFSRAKGLPQGWGSFRTMAPQNSSYCVVDELLAARMEARSVSFSLSEFGCLSGRILRNRCERSPTTDYLTFKPFSMVSAHETPDLFVLFCEGGDIRAFLKVLDDFQYEIEAPTAAFSPKNCQLVALPFIYLDSGLEKVLLCSLGPDSSSGADGGLMAIFPMPIIIRIAETLGDAAWQPGEAMA